MLKSLSAVIVLAAGSLSPAAGQVAPGTREIFSLTTGRIPRSGLPAGITLLNGSVAGAERDGMTMLKASTPTEFLVALPEVLPQDFTLEFDIVPKQCCNPEDLMVEGTATMSRSSGSAQLTWSRDGVSVVGGGPMYQATMPGDLRESLPGQLTSILISVEGETVKLYTNGRRIYTLIERRFARGRVLRVFLGGQDDGDQAVYLARLRVAAGAATVIASGQAASTGTLVTRESSGTTKTAGGGTIQTTTTTTPIVAPKASAGATATGPLPAAPPPAPAPAAPPPAPPPPPPPPAPPPPPPAPAAPMAPVGVGEGSDLEGQPEPAPEPEEIPQAAPTVKSVLPLAGVSFEVFIRKGGSAAAQVVEITMPDGTIKKHLSTINYEPLVLDVAPGSPLDAWANSMLTGVHVRKTGSLSGGSIPAGQQLQFRDALITAMTVPVLDASNTNPAYLRFTLTPEEIIQTALGAPLNGSMNAWQDSDFQLTMGNLGTKGVVRIEPLTGAMELSSSALGEQRIATATPGKRTISNIRLTLAATDANPVTTWLAWFDDFVVKGNNGDDKELTFTLQLGVGKRTDVSGVQRNYTAANLLNLKGSGVGIIAVRWLPQSATTAARMLQVDLYMERLEVVP